MVLIMRTLPSLLVSVVLCIPSLSSVVGAELETTGFCMPGTFLVDAGQPIAATSAASAGDAQCSKTCRMEIVESIPENLSFPNAQLPRSTFFAWRTLLQMAHQDVSIAAYKSSLRGKHILNASYVSTEPGEIIFNAVVNASTLRHVRVRMVENSPPKDAGDNEDGIALERRGILRRSLNFRRLFGQGTMHSKFVIVDNRHFYLGSANFDWRSLNQKMELGVFVRDCPCLAADLQTIFNSYWQLGLDKSKTYSDVSVDSAHVVTLLRNQTVRAMQQPLRLSYRGADALVYIAASPPYLNSKYRVWDLDAILSAINNANRFVYIHVMDYIPMMVYQNPPRYWPSIDEAIRRAAVDRGVEVKLLVAALHFVPQMLFFMKSLQDLNGVVATERDSIEIKIFKVPVVTELQMLIARDRRTHNKFMVSENTAIIGTSNWSGDYFHGSSGVALVVSQVAAQKPFIDDLRQIFLRDFDSDFAFSLDDYMEQCLSSRTGSFCETEKQL